MSYRLIFSLILVALALLFVVQNTAVLEIRFLLWSVQMSRALMMFFLLVIGILIGWFLHGYRCSSVKKDRH